jgi:preprotein translocase subunit SecG
MNILISVLLAIDVLVALLMILVILMQRPKSEGLGAAFGGGVTENIFGAQTTNVLTKFTSWLAGIFFVFTFVLSILYAQRNSGDSSFRRELMREQTGTTQPSPAAGASAAPASAQSPGPAAAPTASIKPSAPAGAVPAASSTASPTAIPLPKSP